MIRFSKKSEFPVSQSELFDWHERPGAFGRLAPPWQSVKLRKHVGGIRDGAEVEVETRFGGIPQTWKIKHSGYIHGERFVDELESGPFNSWRHEHLFSVSEQAGCSTLEDRLEIEPMGGKLGSFVQSGFIKDELRRVFNYRHAALREDLNRANQLGPPPFAGKVLITGITGMLGKATAAYLQTRGYHVLGVSRSGEGPWPGVECIPWDPAKQSIDASLLGQVDAVINLAGESILGVWSQAKMKRIRSSREDAAATLIKAFEENGNWPKVWINASGTGYYGPKTSGEVSEEGASGSGFLAHVCRSWEAAVKPAEKHTRVVYTRLGAVMSPAAGALSIMLRVFNMGGGGVLGNPEAKMPWIGLDDVVSGFEYLLYNDIHGPVNFVSPQTLTQKKLAQTLSKVLKRPALIPAPAGLLKITLGSLAREVFLIDQGVVPARLVKNGFQFSNAAFEDYLRKSIGLTYR